MVQIELSCPDCGQQMFTEMTLEGEENRLPQAINTMLEAAIGVSQHYSFRGMVRCDRCSSMVLSCLTVSAHKGNALLSNLV